MRALQKEKVAGHKAHGNSWMNRWGNGFGRQGGLNFTRFADSRNGGGNAMGKGGGSREREWGILTVTYRQRAEQSKQSICEQFI